MELSELVPTRETCERMKAAGFPQEDAKFAWCGETLAATSTLGFVEIGNSGRLLGCGRPDGGPDWWDADENDEAALAAPTFAEIAERLPELAKFGRVGARWHVDYSPQGRLHAWSSAETAAEVAALLWLALAAKEPRDGH